MSYLLQKKCIPCGTHTRIFTPEEAQQMLKEIPDWKLDSEAKVISRKFIFTNFVEALNAANKIGDLAEREGHHPDLHVHWGKLIVELTTHSIHGLSENDFIVAAKIEALALDK